MPLAWLFQVSPVKARSVPFSRSTLYCMGVSICFHSESGTAFHSASDLTVLLMFPFTPPPSFAPARSDAATRQASPAPREARPMRTSRRVCIRKFYHASGDRPAAGITSYLSRRGAQGRRRFHLRSMGDTHSAPEVPLVGRHLRHPGLSLRLYRPRHPVHLAGAASAGGPDQRRAPRAVPRVPGRGGGNRGHSAAGVWHRAAPQERRRLLPRAPEGPSRRAAHDPLLRLHLGAGGGERSGLRRPRRARARGRKGPRPP